MWRGLLAGAWGWLVITTVARRAQRRAARRRIRPSRSSSWVLVASGPFRRVIRAVAGRRRARRVGLDTTRALTHTVDLLLVALEAGQSMRGALYVVTPHCLDPVRIPLQRAVRLEALGASLHDALVTEAASAPALARVVRTIIAIDEGGSSAGGALRAIAADLRRDQQHRWQIAARAMSIQLLFPLVLCVFPAFVLLALVPVALTAATWP